MLLTVVPVGDRVGGGDDVVRHRTRCRHVWTAAIALTSHHWAPRSQQRQAAQRDPDQDGRAPGCLCHADRVAEHDGTSGRADERLQVHEGAGDLGGDPGLPIGEERERG
jgi:hypothetical protein